MREIKFRAWIGRILYDTVIEYNFKDRTIILAKHYKNLPPLFRSTILSEGDILMQWTGLIDKQGKEIYEGDILEDMGVVRWDCKSSAFIQDSCLDEEFKESADDDELLLRNFESRDFKVIGNIYENPELIK